MERLCNGACFPRNTRVTPVACWLLIKIEKTGCYQDVRGKTSSRALYVNEFSKVI